MPNPSQVSAQNVNSEIFYGGAPANTTLLSMANVYSQRIRGSNSAIRRTGESVQAPSSSNTYTSGSGSVTAPSGAQYAIIYVWGGGGAGYSANPGRGGGGGGLAIKIFKVTGGSTSVSYSVGAGGTASGGNGGNSTATVDSYTITGGGGSGGNASAGGAGGTATNGDMNFSGYAGNSGTILNTAVLGGGAGAFGAANEPVIPGGGSFSSSTGEAYGGGGGVNVSNIGQNGAAGAVSIDWFNSGLNLGYGRLRWGINFPGGTFVNLEGGGYTYDKIYGSSSFLGVNGESINRVNYPDQGSATATATLYIVSNGVMIFEGTGFNTSERHHITWLTSGANTDYTANFALDVAQSVDGGSSATDTDLSLGTTFISWSKTATYSGDSGGQSAGAEGNLIIKSGGTELFRRQILIFAQASVVQS